MKYASTRVELVVWFPIAVICRVLAATRAGCLAWVKRPGSMRAIERDALAELIQRVFAYIERFYNTTRMHSSPGWMLPRESQRQFDEELRAEKQQKKFIGERG